MTDSCYRALNDYTFSQVALLPLLDLSTTGRGVGWLISYIISSAVALYPDCLSVSHFLPFLSLLPPRMGGLTLTMAGWPA